MFRKHVDSKVVRMTVAYTDPTDVVPIPKMYSTEKSELLDIPCAPFITCPPLAAASQSAQPTTSQSTEPRSNQSTESNRNEPDNDDNYPDDDNYLANPKPHREHVGVDEEDLYLPAPKGIGEENLPDPKVVGEETDSESDSFSDKEYEEEELIGKDPLPPVPIVAYDREDPPMSVGSMYPNIQEFKCAFYSLLNLHAFKSNAHL